MPPETCLTYNTCVIVLLLRQSDDRIVLRQMAAFITVYWRTTEDFGLYFFAFYKTRNGQSLFNTKQAQVLGIEIPNSKYADIGVFQDSLAAFIHPRSSSFTYSREDRAKS